MEQLQLREKEIFETLKKIKKSNFVVIGGYAVNAYTLPRFSVDCDIVIKDRKELEKIEEALLEVGYRKEKNYSDEVPYDGKFERFEKELNGDETILILKRLYPQLSPKEIKKIREEKKENIIHDTVKYVKVIPGVIKTLKILKKRGYELAIISNCRHAEIITILKYAKLSIKLFDKIIFRYFGIYN